MLSIKLVAPPFHSNITTLLKGEFHMPPTNMLNSFMSHNMSRLSYLSPSLFLGESSFPNEPFLEQQLTD